MLSRLLRLSETTQLGSGWRGFAQKDRKQGATDVFHFPSHKAYFNDIYYEKKFARVEKKDQGMTMRAYKQLFNESRKPEGEDEETKSEWRAKREDLSKRVDKYIDRTRDDDLSMIKTTREFVKRRALEHEFEFTEADRQRYSPLCYAN